MIQPSVKFIKLLYTSYFYTDYFTSDLIQTFQNRACDLHDNLPIWHSRGVCRAFAKIVLINSLGGATVQFAAYTVF